MFFYDKVKQLCDKRGISITFLAVELGFSKGTPSNWKLSQSAPRPSTIKKIADYFGVDVSFFYNEENPSTHSPFSPTKEDYAKYGLRQIQKKRLPVLGNIACGEPIFAEEDHETFIDASMDIDADFCLVAKGDSMIGARINDGDMVFVKSMPIVKNGEIAVVAIGDEATLKYFYYYPEEQKLMLSPANNAYAPLMFVGAELDTIRCLGKAVCFMSNL